MHFKESRNWFRR